MINLNHPIQTHKNMMSALFIPNQSDASVRKKTLSQKVEVGVTSLVFATITLVAIISLAYLANANRNATKGYALKALEAKRSQLIIENEVWDMEIAKVQALSNLQNDPTVTRMVRANEPLYLRGDTAIASR